MSPSAHKWLSSQLPFVLDVYPFLVVVLWNSISVPFSVARVSLSPAPMTAAALGLMAVILDPLLTSSVAVSRNVPLSTTCEALDVLVPFLTGS